MPQQYLGDLDLPDRNSMNEKPFFFPSRSGERLFGVLHEPEARPHDEGFVFCHALAEEKLWSHRVFLSFARYLSARGHIVLRFDMTGEGDSEGCFEKTTIETRLKDIATAREYLLEHFSELSGISLLGLRLGATLAQISATRDDRAVNRLVLWEPIISGKTYAQELLRVHLANQMAVFGRVTINRNQLVAMMEAGELVNIEGYGLTYSLYEAICNIQLDSSEHVLEKPSHVVQIGKENQAIREDLASFSGLHPQTTVDTIAEQPFWRETRFYCGQAASLYGKTLEWMESASG